MVAPVTRATLPVRSGTLGISHVVLRKSFANGGAKMLKIVLIRGLVALLLVVAVVAIIVAGLKEFVEFDSFVDQKSTRT